MFIATVLPGVEPPAALRVDAVVLYSTCTGVQYYCMMQGDFFGRAVQTVCAERTKHTPYSRLRKPAAPSDDVAVELTPRCLRQSSRVRKKVLFMFPMSQLPSILQPRRHVFDCYCLPIRNLGQRTISFSPYRQRRRSTATACSASLIITSDQRATDDQHMQKLSHLSEFLWS